MALLTVRGLKMNFGLSPLFEGVGFDVERRERVGLVGLNGAGKSTLLKIVAGTLAPDAGSVRCEGAPLLIDQLKRLDGACVIDAGERLRALGRLGQVTLPEEATASGGERMKLALSGALAGGAELLLLDEPTNDLDFDGTKTLIDLLNGYDGAALIVSHDRYFLDAVTTRTFELFGGELHIYEGNYSAYRELKQLEFDAEQRRYESDKKEQRRVSDAIEQAQRWAARAHRDSTISDGSGLKMGKKENKRARAKKIDSQAKNTMKRLENMQKTAQAAPVAEQRVDFSLRSGTKGSKKAGKRLLQVSDVAFAYPNGRALFTDVRFTLLHGEHAVFFGRNGTGKSTFIKLLLGELAPTKGEIELSPGVRGRIGVLTQGADDLPVQSTGLAFLTERLGVADALTRALLGRFGLTAQHLARPIGSMSLGERMKLKLALLLLDDNDLLVLDEPTACLDLHARHALEEAVCAYPGAVLAISHDIAFLQAVGQKTLLLENGALQRLEYPFAQWLAQREDPARV